MAAGRLNTMARANRGILNPALALAFALAAVAIAACGTLTEPDPGRSVPSNRLVGFVAGTVFAGPTCPVETVSAPCPDRPVVGATVELYRGETAVAATRTDARGHFWLAGPPGLAMILVHTPSELGVDTHRSVRVVSGRTVEVSLTLDTGVR